MTRATRPLFALLLAVLPLSAWGADDPMTAEEFEAYVVGKTLTYSMAGEVYGTEQYLTNRRVLWAFSGDECREGHWYAEERTICFVYDYNPDNPQCWMFWAKENGLGAQFMNDPEGTELSEVDQSAKPLACPGPNVGV